MSEIFFLSKTVVLFPGDHPIKPFLTVLGFKVITVQDLLEIPRQIKVDAVVSVRDILYYDPDHDRESSIVRGMAFLGIPVLGIHEANEGIGDAIRDSLAFDALKVCHFLLKEEERERAVMNFVLPHLASVLNHVVHLKGKATSRPGSTETVPQISAKDPAPMTDLETMESSSIDLDI